jgi:hypothetical protein
LKDKVFQKMPHPIPELKTSNQSKIKAISTEPLIKAVNTVVLCTKLMIFWNPTWNIYLYYKQISQVCRTLYESFTELRPISKNFIHTLKCQMIKKTGSTNQIVCLSVKLSACVIKHYAMKAYGAWMYSYMHF